MAGPGRAGKVGVTRRRHGNSGFVDQQLLGHLHFRDCRDRPLETAWRRARRITRATRRGEGGRGPMTQAPGAIAFEDTIMPVKRGCPNLRAC